MESKFFTNVGENTLLNKLAGVFGHAEVPIASLDILVAYFYASGYFKLRPHLDRIEQIRILVGINVDKLIKMSHDKALLQSVSDDDACRDYLDALVKEVRDANYDAEVEEGIRQFFEDIINEKIVIRAHPKRNIHAKLYIYRPKNFNEHASGGAITGSSNLTEAGLGHGGASSNYEFNVLLNEYRDVKFATDEFEKLWDEAVALPVSAVLEARKKTFLQDITPYYLYMKFLLEYFGPDFDEDLSGDWPEEYQKFSYQVDAVNEAFKKIEKFNGLFLADVVGLGKTIIASAVAQSYWLKRPHDCGILLVCPPALIENWKDTLGKFLPKARIDYTTPGMLRHKLDHAIHYDLVMVDEAHRFRNNATAQYGNLQQICKTRTSRGGSKSVILITATPFNNRPSDLFNQIRLFMDDMDTTLTGEPLRNFFRKVDKEHGKILKMSNKAQIIQQTKELYERVRQQAVEEITIRRTRTDLEKIDRYRDDLKARKISFPKPELKKLIYGLSPKQNELYEHTVKMISGVGDGNQGLTYMRYRVVEHLHPVIKRRYKHTKSMAQQLAGIIKVLLLKRMDSSFHAFTKTLERFIAYSQNMLDAMEEGYVRIPAKQRPVDEIADLAEEEDLEKIFKEENDKVAVEDVSADFREGVERDHRIMEELLARWREEVGGSDPKYDKFAATLASMLSADINPEERLVIFTESADTMEYLSDRLSQSPHSCLAVKSGTIKRKLREIKRNFDANDAAQLNDHQILITTDVLAEGVNLHRANVVVNYDTPWNATKLMQRIGRLNRIGAKAETIWVHNCFPAEAIDNHLELEKRALVKLQAFHTALGEDSQVLSKEEEVDTFGIFDEEVAEEENRTLKFLEELREFKREDKSGYEFVRRLPLKVRNGRRMSGHAGKTFVFARTADKATSSFYLAAEGEEPASLGFLASADLLKAPKDEEALPIHQNHHLQVQAALEKFSSEQRQKHEASGSGSSLSGQEFQALNLLRGIIRENEENAEYKELASNAIAVVESKNFRKFSSQIMKMANDRNVADDPEAVDKIMDLIRENLPQIAVDFKDLKEADETPTVVIAQSFD